MRTAMHIFSDVSDMFCVFVFLAPMCKTPKPSYTHTPTGTEEAPTCVNRDALRAGVQRKSRLVFPLRCISICGVLETLIYVCSSGLQRKRQMSKKSEELSHFAGLTQVNRETEENKQLRKKCLTYIQISRCWVNVAHCCV